MTHPLIPFSSKLSSDILLLQSPCPTPVSSWRSIPHLTHTHTNLMSALDAHPSNELACQMDGAWVTRRTKSRGPKGLQFEVGAQRAPRLIVVIWNLSFLPALCFLPILLFPLLPRFLWLASVCRHQISEYPTSLPLAHNHTTSPTISEYAAYIDFMMYRVFLKKGYSLNNLAIWASLETLQWPTGSNISIRSCQTPILVGLANIIWHSLGSSRKSVHERPQNSDGWQVIWSVFWAIWLKSQDPYLSNDVYEGGVFIRSKSVKTRIFSKKTG